MIWMTAPDQYAMLVVRHTRDGYQLIRMSEAAEDVLETFANYDEAIDRWAQMEKSILRG